VKQHRLKAQPLPEAAHQLRGQTNFRDEHQHLAARGQLRVDKPQVDFRLATAGYTINQIDAETFAFTNCLKSAFLIGVQGRSALLFDISKIVDNALVVTRLKFFNQRFVELTFFCASPERH
jgi:hypothetical protein